jgi:hypothetical protein
MKVKLGSLPYFESRGRRADVLGGREHVGAFVAAEFFVELESVIGVWLWLPLKRSTLTTKRSR